MEMFNTKEHSDTGLCDPACRHALRRLLIVSAICCGLLAPGTAWSQHSPKPEIEFTRTIKPILEAKCYECHGPSMRSGGVRFDQRDAVVGGGYTQQPLLGGTLQTNEIYRRVASADVSYRMPKGKPPLTAAELALFRRWVEAGTPWPADPAPIKIGDLRDQWLNREAWLDYAERWVNQVPGFVIWLCVMLVLQCGLLFVERYKNAVRLGQAWTARPWARNLTPLQKIGLTHYVLVLAAMSLILSQQVIRGMQTQRKVLEDSLDDYRHVTTATGQPTATSIYGNPPVPIRSEHQPRLSGTYYRGNCERSPQLFNGGNYRTATLHVSLVDEHGHALQAGDRVTPNNLSIRFELDRAKGTTDTLFGDSIAKGVFLTRQVLAESRSPVTAPIERMKVVEPGWKWVATFPLRGPRDELQTSLSGLIYVYQGTIDGDQARGSVHYGITYDLHFKDLTLQPESDVWLGSLFWSPNLESPRAGKVPLKEWFNEQPIPEITGKNSTDPKLLGIPEHQK